MGGGRNGNRRETRHSGTGRPRRGGAVVRVAVGDDNAREPPRAGAPEGSRRAAPWLVQEHISQRESKPEVNGENRGAAACEVAERSRSSSVLEMMRRNRAAQGVKRSRSSSVVEVGRLDVRIKRFSVVGRQIGGGGRGEITRLSKASARRLVWLLRNGPDLGTFITLTYPGEYPTDGRKVKRDLHVFLKWLRRCYQAWGVWVLEFQLRGAPHFMIWTQVHVPWEAVGWVWFEIVGSGDRRHLGAGTSVEAWRGDQISAGVYAAKYAAKATQKDVPKEYRQVGRFWGAFGGYKAEVERLTGTRRELGPVVRVARAAAGKQLGRKWRDHGERSMTVRNAAGVVRRFVAWEGVE